MMLMIMDKKNEKIIWKKNRKKKPEWREREKKRFRREVYLIINFKSWWSVGTWVCETNIYSNQFDGLF